MRMKSEGRGKMQAYTPPLPPTPTTTPKSGGKTEREKEERIGQHASKNIDNSSRDTKQLPKKPLRSRPAADESQTGREGWQGCGNDPSAGSPTETLLRLHLPLNDEV